ncbi:hypothetical protein KD27_02530 [Smithella sp. D17]|jgi:hypothetical protein|nr:hypothetical protein KD27_02530 [Smithella sp. D17]
MKPIQEDKGALPEIKFKYIFSKEYNPKYATGVFGGVTPSGEIVANFFLERHALPISQTQVVEPSGQLGTIVKNEPDDLQKTMVRVVENGVILDVFFAKKFNAWLTEKINEAETIKEAEKQSDATVIDIKK